MTAAASRWAGRWGDDYPDLSLEEAARAVDAEAPANILSVWGDGTIQIRIRTLRALRAARLRTDAETVP